MSFEEEEVKRKNLETFNFSIPTLKTNKSYDLEIPVEIPFGGSISELTQRLITHLKLPCFVEKKLQSSLEEFIQHKTIEYHDDVANTAIEKCRSNEIDVEEVIKKWEKLYKEETVEHGEKRRASDSEVFSNVYHKLVHSGPAFQTMLQVEQSYALAVSHLMRQKNVQINNLTSRQTEETKRALEKVDNWSGKMDSEAYINEIVAKHFEDQNLLQGRWNSEIDTLKETQRREYREWIMKLLEEHQTNTGLYSPSSPSEVLAFSDSKPESSLPLMEESFTIHLGSQMKQMHNIRIMSADILDFCRMKLPTDGNSVNLSPHRLQTALGLYSNDLCGLVMLNDTNDLSGLTGLAKEFGEVCESSTEFHFPNLSEQLESLKTQTKDAIVWRNSCQHPGNLTTSEQQSRRSASKHLQTGDIFITKHSNLSSVHIIFHLIVDDSLRSSDINSRHSAILGLRNILKTACSNDITTLTIPVLLMHEMTEEMTVAWCTKRAELVFKCVKGFMIEMASWGGSDLKNLQFLVPKGISEEVFGSLATMLPSIFRVSNPLVFKVSSTPTTPKNK
ncbi:protein C12orf4 homolog [Planococcus citri]|uniref:protein C12orf4 homolog n=1 Tax=Planococcus citri TaxID=170843 RepID=UPI0031F81835